MRVSRSTVGAVLAVATAGVLITSCSTTSDKPTTVPTTTVSEPIPVPPAPVRADDKGSEDAFAAKLATDPCPTELSAATLSILQRYQQKSHSFSGDWSAISVTAAKGASATGIPQCTLGVKGAGPVTTISLAAVTAAANKQPAGTLSIFDVIGAADPTVPGHNGTEPACAITQEFLSRLTATGLKSQWRTEPKPLGDTIQVRADETSTAVAEWKGQVIRVQRRCADTVTTSGRPDNSPDWIIQVDTTGAAADVEAARKIGNAVSAYLARWVTGQPTKL